MKAFNRFPNVRVESNKDLKNITLIATSEDPSLFVDIDRILQKVARLSRKYNFKFKLSFKRTLLLLEVNWK